MLKVFISSTSEDLYDFRNAVKEALLGHEWLPIMMESFGTSPEDTVEYCCSKVRECDLLVLLIGFRRGWVPDVSRGGDGIRSITAYELETAAKLKIPVRVFLAKDNWPGKLWDKEQEAREWICQFRNGLNRPAVFFEHEDVKRDARPPVPQNFFGLVQKELSAHREWLLKSMQQTLLASAAAPHMQQASQGLEKLFDKAALPREVICAAYRESHPQGVNDLPRSGDSVLMAATAVSRLSALPQSANGNHPLLQFIDRIARQTEGLQQQAFLDWHQRLTAELGILDRRQQDKLIAFPASATPKDTVAHVLVRCEPSTIRPREMLVQAWLFENGVRTGLPLEKEPWTVQNRGTMLARLYNQVLQHIRSSRPPVIEFMVPRTYASEDFDQWKMLLDDLGAIRLGEYCPVVVRFIERCKLAASLPLRRRWDKIAEHLKSPCRVVDLSDEAGSAQSRALWVAERPHGETLFRHLSLHESIACVVLQARPKEGGAANKKDVFQALLATGIPVSLWPRSAASIPQHVEQSLMELLKDHPLEELPWRLLQHRLRTAEQTVASNRLTLIWDDPARVPPSAIEEHPLGLEIHD